MKIISNPTTAIDSRGNEVTSFNFSYIEEPGDREKELEYIRNNASFLSSHGHKGNKWERLLRAKEENISKE
jgi:hypothetical protein